MTVAAAISATTVLPEPTSPCTSRNMRCGKARSLTISLTACCCEWRQRVWQGIMTFARSRPSLDVPTAGLPAHMCAHQR